MNLAEGESPVATYYFRGHTDQSNTSVLTNRRLVVIYKGLEESYPLSKITAVRVQYQRSLLLVFIGMIFAVISIYGGVEMQFIGDALHDALVDSRSSFTAPPAKPVADGEFFVHLIKIVGWPLVAFTFFASCWLAFYGWRGQTGLQIANFAGEKLYLVAGRDAKLVEFGEQISHQIT